MRGVLECGGGKLRIDGSTLDLDEYTEIVVVGGGKAAAGMAGVLEEVLGDRLTEGVVVTNDPLETDRIAVVEGSHPTPNEAGMEGARRVLSLAERASEGTLVLCLLSGGGSALLPAPVDGVAIDELRSLTDDLLSSGATIGEINAVRKHLSALKGGRLAGAAAPATMVTLLVSDVVGNDLSVIASGPTVPDESTYDDALVVLERYALTPPATIRAHLERGAAGEEAETPGADDPAFERTQAHILADGFTALAATGSAAEERGYTPVVLSSRVEGEAREAAKTHIAIAEEARATGNPISPPVAFLSGGETTVTIRGDGVGGPNQEFVLGGALALESEGSFSPASIRTEATAQPTSPARSSIGTPSTTPEKRGPRSRTTTRPRISWTGTR